MAMVSPASTREDGVDCAGGGSDAAQTYGVCEAQASESPRSPQARKAGKFVGARLLSQLKKAFTSRFLVTSGATSVKQCRARALTHGRGKHAGTHALQRDERALFQRGNERVMGLPSTTNSGEVPAVEAARVHVGRVPLDPVTLPGAIERIVELAVSGRGGTVYTPNVDHVVVAEEDPAFLAAYSAVSLSLVDGTPVLWGGRLLGHALPEKVSGSDLFEPLVARAAAAGLSIFLLGGGPGVAELASAELVRRHPRLRVAGVLAPRIDAAGRAENEAQVIEALRLAEPDLIFVACGAPKSELFSHRVRALLGSAVLVCVGAAIDFAAGTARRAPRWMSNVGLEWAYRLAQEPRRLARRYLLRDPKFFWILLRQLFEGAPPSRRLPAPHEASGERALAIPSAGAEEAPFSYVTTVSSAEEAPAQSGVVGTERSVNDVAANDVAGNRR